MDEIYSLLKIKLKCKNFSVLKTCQMHLFLDEISLHGHVCILCGPLYKKYLRMLCYLAYKYFSKLLSNEESSYLW